VLSHVRIAADPERLHGMRIPAGQVDLLLGADLIVAAAKEPLSDVVRTKRLAVIVNTHDELPRASSATATSCSPARRCCTRCARQSRGRGRDARRHAARVGALGRQHRRQRADCSAFAFQRGLLPVSGGALYRALELYGRNVEENKLAFDWGRFAAESPEQVRAARERPARVSTTARRRSKRRFARREEFLVRVSRPRVRAALSARSWTASPPWSSACGRGAARCRTP